MTPDSRDRSGSSRRSRALENYPALLLELPGNDRRGLQVPDPLRERGGTGLGLPHAARVARPDVHHRRARPAPSKPGVVVAHDANNGKTKPIYGMGRHNHENSVAIPGFDEARRALRRRHVPDERRRPSSQLYMYTAADSRRALGRHGHAPRVRGRRHGQRLLRPPAGRRRSAGTFLPVPEEHREGQGSRRRARADASRRLPELPGALRRTVGAAGRAAVGARPVGQQGQHTERLGGTTSSTSSGSRTSRTTSAEHVERRLHRRLGPGDSRGTANAADDVDERAHLQARARPRRHRQSDRGRDLDPRPG